MATTYVNGPELAYDYESLGTLTASTGLTSTKYDKQVAAQGEGDQVYSPIRRATAVMISVEVADIRYTVDGTTPTTTAGGATGHLAVLGDIIVVSGYQNIKNFRAINAVAASGSALKVSYFRI